MHFEELSVLDIQRANIQNLKEGSAKWKEQKVYYEGMLRMLDYVVGIESGWKKCVVYDVSGHIIAEAKD